MISNQIFPVRNPLIIQEKVQPKYSQFVLRYDSIDFPIFVDESAAEVIRLCDGTKKIADICEILAKKYEEPSNYYSCCR